MKRFKTGISLLMCAVFIFSFFSYGLSASRKPIKAAADISTTNYTTWTAATLGEATESVNKFLTPLKGSDPTRPYKDNATWSEGSLAALDIAYQASAAVSATAGISADLSREQLIQTVRGLEQAGTKNKASYTALNNYPDDSGNYTLDYAISNMGIEQGEQLDVMFVLDWSGSMKRQGVGAATESSMLHGRRMVESFSQKLLESNVDARIRLIAHNQSVNNTSDVVVWNGTTYVPRGGVQKDSGFFAVDSNKQYLQTIQNMYSMNPAETEDAIPWVIDTATKELAKSEANGGVRDNAKTVLIVLSDFQLNITTSGGPNEYTIKNTYVSNLTSYFNSLKTKTGKDPVYIAAAYYNAYHTPGMGGSGVIPGQTNVMETETMTRDGWSAVHINETNFDTAEARLKDAIDLGVGYLPWTASLTTNAFNFIDYSSSDDDLVSLGTKNLTFEGIADGVGTFKMTVDTTKYSNPKKGDMASATPTATAGTTKESVNFSPTSKLFLPITDAAIELYKYSGSGSETAVSNYVLADTVVSSNYSSFGGTNYSKNSSILSSLDYKATLTKQNALDALKAGLGTAEYNKLEFMDSLNANSLTVQFDSSKNVYKIYTKEVSTTSTITIEHWVKGGAKIPTSAQGDLSINGTTGALANITPTTISGYTYVDSDSEPLANVTYGATNKTVKLYYTENPTTSTITIEHWVKGGAKISTSAQGDRSINGTIGALANITPTMISGYTYVDSDSEPLANVTYGATNKTVKLYYQEVPKTAIITIVYRNSADGSKIQGDKTIEGLAGTVPTIATALDGYEFLFATPDLADVKFGETTTVTLFYKVGQGKVTVRYVDATKGTAIQHEGQSSKEFTGQIGTTANIGTPPAIDGYNFAYSLPGQDEWATLQYKVADQTVTLYYIPITEITLTIIFEKDNGEELAKFVKVNQKIGTTIDLRNTYSDVTAKLNELLSSYELYEFPANDGAYVIPNKDTTVTYKFRGTLFLSSAPELLEFGDDHTIMHYGAFESGRPTYKQPLTVTDTRSTLTNWKIKAKLTEDMHSRKDPTFILTNVLYYQNGSENIAINSTSSEPIITGKHNDVGDVNVSKAEWEDKTNGFQFKLSDKQFRQIDDYDGTIQFTLEEAP
ncbi:MucBP domain-containing protein [uncultured Enterococcus sp.]|uniref:MucBP domain-containing protein n=1 Tax=uncultured Enterococcus sp. TaxID=167972 RepID=UPI002AA7580D|nr:MucBP domain-containing protein [uncultured Enterococcus sp.]